MSLSGRTVRTDLSELGCVSRFNGATSLWFLDLFLFFRMVQACFFTCGICDHWRSSFCFSVWRIPVGCDRCGLMMLYSMAWIDIFETGYHCLVEPCARNCPSSVVYHGSTGRLHCSFLICFCCLRWCKHDFLLWWIWVRPVEISRLRFFWLPGGGREMWGPSEQWKPRDGRLMDFDGRKMERKKRLERACSWSFSGLIHCESFRVFHQISACSRCYGRPSRGVTHSNQVGWTGQYRFRSSHVLRETWNRI